MDLNAGSYADVEAFLNSFVDYERLAGGAAVEYNTRNFDRDNFRGLLRELGDPHLKYAAVHVAGTKGKGSTCAFVAAALQECGLKVGFYSSPHIDVYTERIQVNGRRIPDAEFCRILNNLAARAHFDQDPPQERSVAVAQGSFRTVFELLTATAFLYFAEQEVDVAVVETGLGGRLDSTNVFDVPGAGPLVSVICPIGRDHTAILGNTIEEIAREKLGILQPHSVVVLAPQPPEWAAQVQFSLEARLSEIGQEEYLDAGALISAQECVEEAPDGTSSPDVTYAEFRLDRESAPPESLLGQSMVNGLITKSRMHGAHQLDNIRTALGAILALENAPGFSDWAANVSWRRPEEVGGLDRGFSGECIRKGIGAARLHGRFEVVTRQPLDVVDGAHCPLSAAAMADTYNAQYGVQDAILVLGLLKDKDPVAICEAVRDRMRVVAMMCCTPPSPRALPADETALAASQVFPAIPVETVPEPEEAIRAVLDLRDPSQAVVVFGSMYLVGVARRTLKEQATAVSEH